MLTHVHGKLISFETFGKGKTVLFIHGWGGSRQNLKPLAKLVSKKCKAVIFDLPGFGKSENPDPDWGIAEYAQVIFSFVKKQRLAPVILFGHSFGGSLALYFTAHHPELVEKLIVCAPSYKREKKRVPLVSAVKDSIPAPMKRLLYRVFFPQSELYKYPHLESNFRKIVTQDVGNEALSIKKPTLILWGDLDRYVPVSFAHELQTLIQGSELEIIKGKGHGMPLTSPELVYNKLEKFL